jgi:hypothetical protein
VGQFDQVAAVAHTQTVPNADVNVFTHSSLPLMGGMIFGDIPKWTGSAHIMRFTLVFWSRDLYANVHVSGTSAPGRFLLVPVVVAMLAVRYVHE